MMLNIDRNITNISKPFHIKHNMQHLLEKGLHVQNSQIFNEKRTALWQLYILQHMNEI